MKQHILRQQFVSILCEFLEILGIFRNKRMIMVDSTMFILNQNCVIRTYKARQRGFEAFKSWYFSEAAAFLLNHFQRGKKPATITSCVWEQVYNNMCMGRESSVTSWGFFKNIATFTVKMIIPTETILVSSMRHKYCQ